MPPFLVASAGGNVSTHPLYLEVDQAALRARLVRPPIRSEIPVQCDEQLVVEF